MKSQTIISKLQPILVNGSKSEKVIIKYMLSNFPISALGNLPNISKNCNVSVATIQRLVIKLGFKSFPAFHTNILEVLDGYRSSSPLKRWGSNSDNKNSTLPTPITPQYQKSIANIIETFESIELNTLAKITAVLSDNSLSILCIGGRFTGLLTNLFARHLTTIRTKVQQFSPYPEALTDIVLNCNANTALIIADIRRYDTDILTLAKLAKEEKHATIILLTDKWGSPVKQFADITIPTYTETDDCWDSNMTILAVLEELMDRVTIALGDKGKSQLKSREDLLKNQLN